MLVVVTHEYDIFARRPTNSLQQISSPYLLFDVLRHLSAMGHEWKIVRGANPVSGDVALLHVDSTIVGEEYLALKSHFRRTINFGTGDISKRKVSRLLLSRGDRWDGPVIVKSDLNNDGWMEDWHNAGARKLGRPLPHPGAVRGRGYRVLDRLSDVEDAVWADPSLIVERFLPESDGEGGYVLRTWVFMGDRERCTRMVTPTSISKASAVLRYEPVAVPAALRDERARLNFDFGKFDFVLNDGEPLLLDANRTPGVATAIHALLEAGARNLAEGLETLIREGPPPRN